MVMAPLTLFDNYFSFNVTDKLRIYIVNKLSSKMKNNHKTLLATMFLALLLPSCQIYNYEERSSRNIEPEHRVVTVPIVADVELLSTNKIVYSEKFYNVELNKSRSIGLFKKKRSNESSNSELIETYKYTALAHAVKKYNADFLIGAIFDVDYSQQTNILEVTITGFPAKYKEIRKASEEDAWFIAPQSRQ